MISPLLLLSLIGCGGNLETPEAEQAFEACLVTKTKKSASYSSEAYIDCGRETDFNWDFIDLYFGTHLPDLKKSDEVVKK